MRDSARYAWWLLIVLFAFIIAGNVVQFWLLFRGSEGRGLASSNQRLGAEFQIRYALAVERLGMGGLATKVAQEAALAGLEEAYAPYEAAVYRAIVAHAFQQRDAAADAPRPARFAVGDAYTCGAPLAGDAPARRAHPTATSRPRARRAGVGGRAALAVRAHPAGDDALRTRGRHGTRERHSAVAGAAGGAGRAGAGRGAAVLAG
jgi:hypothetical protein